MSSNNKNFKRTFSKSNSATIKSSINDEYDEKEFFSCSDCSSETTNKPAIKCNNFNCQDQTCFSDSSRTNNSYYISSKSSSSVSNNSSSTTSTQSKSNKVLDDRNFLAEQIEKLVKDEFSNIAEEKLSSSENKNNKKKSTLPTVNPKVSSFNYFYFSFLMN